MKPLNGNDLAESAMRLGYLKGFCDCFSYFKSPYELPTVFSSNGDCVLVGQKSKSYLGYVAQESFSAAKKSCNTTIAEENALKFLANRDDLLKLVQAARNKLDEYFPSNLTKYVLCRTYDPETQTEGLMLEIHTDQNFEDAMACLEQFEDDWWLDNMPTNGDKFVIDVVFA